MLFFCNLYVQQEEFNTHWINYVYNNAASIIFSSFFSCLVCHNEQNSNEKQNAIINECSAWNAHVSLTYTDVEENWLVWKLSKSFKFLMNNETYIYFLCNNKYLFISQHDLTIYCKMMHVKNRQKFDNLFLCFECCWCNMSNYLIISTFL